MARRMIPNLVVAAVLAMSSSLWADPAPAGVLNSADVTATIAAADAAPVPTAAPAPAKPAPAAAPKAPVVAIVASVKGVVERREASDPAGKWQAAKVKDTLTALTLIRTGMGSQAVIHIRDRIRLTIRSSTKVGIGQVVGPQGGLIKTRLGLKYGSIRTQIDKTRGANDVRISTPDAALAVTGSDADINFGSRTDLRVRESTWKFTVADLLVLAQPGQSSSTSGTPQSRTEFFDRSIMPIIDQQGLGTEFGYGGADGRERNPLQYAGNPGDRWFNWDGPTFGPSQLRLLNCYGTGWSRGGSSPINGSDDEISPGFGKSIDIGLRSGSSSILTGMSFSGGMFHCIRSYRYEE